MEVLIINPPNIPFTDLNILIEPIDILTLATYVQQRVSVQVLDMDVKRISATNFETYLQNKKFSHVVLVYDYHIPLHTDEAFNEIKKIAQIAHNKGSTVILI
ncbi:MAG: hypothetical protein LBG52_04680 [Candidatus Peribacteria bacterium]|jgi:hypothetical protein|nr:hypothetical protein [Candidatus Peribacteria bacterium]